MSLTSNEKRTFFVLQKENFSDSDNSLAIALFKKFKDYQDLGNGVVINYALQYNIDNLELLKYVNRMLDTYRND